MLKFKYLKVQISRSTLLIFSLALLVDVSPGFARDGGQGPAKVHSVGPDLSVTARVLESAPLDEPMLVYFDQAAADAVGLKLPPGRVGNPDFDRAVAQTLGREIKVGSKVIENPQANRSETGDPYLFIEKDAHGGSGRAGNFEAQEGVWVNIKGIGVTGAGGTRNKVPGPPTDKFTSHQDGSAQLEEAIKEAIASRMADAELKAGSNRVIAIFATKRTLTFPDGNSVIEASIVRAPMRRYDQRMTANPELVLQSLAEANSKRILKGDFVNYSNMGASGEWVDFGCMSFTCGYAPLVSSQRENLFYEGARTIENSSNAKKYLGQSLLNQMGIPEAMIQSIHPESAEVESKLTALASKMTELVYAPTRTHQIGVSTLLDYQLLTQDQMTGNIKFHIFFRDAAANYFATPLAERDALLKSEIQRLIGLTADKTGPIQNEISNFVQVLHSLFADIQDKNPVQDSQRFSQAIRKIAHFKNRDIEALARPQMVQNIGNLIQQFKNNRDPRMISDFIENTVQGNRFGTSPAVDSRMIARANREETEIFIRADFRSGQAQGLYLYPELPAAGPGEKMGFRITTDGWQTHKDIASSPVTTSVGDYFKVSFHHGSLPVTEAPIQMAPYVIRANGEIHWLKDGLNIVGPPMVFNERLGLPADMTRAKGSSRDYAGKKTHLLPEDLNPKMALDDGRVVRKALSEVMQAYADAKTPAERYSLNSQLSLRVQEYTQLYDRDPRFREFSQSLEKRKNGLTRIYQNLTDHKEAGGNWELYPSTAMSCEQLLKTEVPF